METRTVYDQRRVSRFNIYLICILSIVLTIQGFVSMGKDFGIKAGIATGTASIVVVLIYFLRVPDRIGAVLIPICPFISSLALSHFTGGNAKMFLIYMLGIGISSLYFNKRSLVFFVGLATVILTGIFLLSPVSLLGVGNTHPREFLSRMISFLCLGLVMYFLTSWGNEYLERALEQEEEARRILANLRKLVEENSQVSDSLNKNLEISNRQTQEISAAVEIQDSNIAALAQGFGEARAISEGLKDSLDLDSI